MSLNYVVNKGLHTQSKQTLNQKTLSKPYSAIRKPAFRIIMSATLLIIL